MRLLFCTWSHSLTPTKRKKKIISESVGNHRWILCYKNFPFQTQTTYSSLWAKKAKGDSRRAQRNNTYSTTSSPLFNPEKQGLALSGALQKVWTRSQTDTWDQNEDNSDVIRHGFREFPRMPYVFSACISKHLKVCWEQPKCYVYSLSNNDAIIPAAELLNRPCYARSLC